MWLEYVSILAFFFVIANCFRPHFHHSLSGFHKHHGHLEEKTTSLVLVHAIFRHGNRTGQPDEFYPKDPYINETYFPFGLGQLTNAGKAREYSIGKSLRERYDRFLGPFYYPQIIEATSTDYNRTKVSLELVLAGLFPPKGIEIWKYGLNWLPIPYNYNKRSEDPVLLGVLCPNYLKEYNSIVQSDKYKSEINEYRDLFEYISNHTGSNVTTYLDIYQLYFGLSTEEEWGFKLPDWTKKVWPDILKELTTKEYFTATRTTNLNRMASGYFVKKLLKDTKEKIKNMGEEHGKKIFLYSAHESNIAELLIYLNLFDEPHVPNYGSYIIFEVHYINNVYGFKIYYQNYVNQNNKLSLLKMPACEEFCPIDKFEEILEEYMPSDDLCNNI